MRPISAEGFLRPEHVDGGALPTLKWIEIERLRVDDVYQRGIFRTGQRNIRKIVQNFTWTKFSPVIVARIEDGFFAVIDGQHRTTAAAACGFSSVPCQIVEASAAEQAGAFAAINGVVTQMSAMQIHHAEVAAGKPEAVELDRICRDAGVEILRYPIASNLQKPGQTMAANRLAAFLARYGAGTLKAALESITRTSNNVPGLIRAGVVQGLCEALSQLPDWRGERLIAAMDACRIEEMWDRHRLSGNVARSLATDVTVYLKNYIAPARKLQIAAPVAPSPVAAFREPAERPLVAGDSPLFPRARSERRHRCAWCDSNHQPRVEAENQIGKHKTVSMVCGCEREKRWTHVPDAKGVAA